MADDYLSAAAIGVLEGIQKGVMPFLEDRIRSKSEMRKMLLEQQLWKERQPIETASKIEVEKAKPPSYYNVQTGETLEKGLKPFNQNQQKNIQDYRESESFKRSLKFVMKELEGDQELREFRKQELSLGQMNNLVSLARAGNTVSSSGLGVKMARAMGEVGVLTETDVTRYVESGQLTRKAGDRLLRWTQGKPSEATLDEINEIADILKLQYKSRVDPIVTKYAKRLNSLEGVPIEDAIRLLSIPEHKTESQKNEMEKDKKPKLDLPPINKQKILKKGKTKSGISFELIED